MSIPVTASLPACLPHTAGLTDPQHVAVLGGSHGGFLTGHLVGQQPEAFCCAVLRNPVCDLSTMVHMSDIPGGWGTRGGWGWPALVFGAPGRRSYWEGGLGPAGWQLDCV